jgi:hypothetical protein
MSMHPVIKEFLSGELRWRTYLSDELIEKIVDGFAERLERGRYAVVPRYLTDDMYEAQKSIDGSVIYNTANKMFVAAVNEHNKKVDVIKDDEPGRFW